MNEQKFKEFLGMLHDEIFKYLEITNYSASHLSVVIEKADKTDWFDIHLIKLSGKSKDREIYKKWLSEVKTERGL